MELWILGANGTYPTAGRPSAGFLLSHDGSRVWVDAGSGTLDAVQRLMDPAELDAVIISHVHADHCADIFGLYHYLRFGAGAPGRVPLVVPEGAFDRMASFVGSGGGPGLGEVFAPHVPGAGTDLVLGSMSFRFSLADHTVPTLQLRAEAAGRSIAYSADTGVASDLVTLAGGANTLLCEATFQGSSKPVPHHLTATEAGDIARRAGVERLILTHLTPTLDPQQSLAEATAVFDGDVMVAAPSLEVLI